MRKALKRRGAGLIEADDEARHEVRIVAKKLRYATEFFAMLYADGKTGRRHKRFLNQLEKLQESLGDLNDLATAPEVLARFGLIDCGRPESVEFNVLVHDAAAKYSKLLGLKVFW